MPVACAETVLTGSDGALYVTPAATAFCLNDFTDFPAGTEITVPANDYRVGDPIEFTTEGAAKLDTALTVGTTYYVIAKTATGITVSATKGGAAIVLKGDGGIAATVLTGTPVVFTKGPITALGTVVGGTGYADGALTGVALSGGSGTGATANITVAGGVVTVATLNAAGTGYTAGDSLTSTAIPGIPATTGPIATLGTVTGGSAYTDGTYPGVALTGGTGTGATADITVAAGAVTTVTIVNAGTGYTAADALSAVAANIGTTGTGFTVPVATITAATVPGSGFTVAVATVNAIAPAPAPASDTPGAHINIAFAEAAAVCQVSNVELSFTRGEIDVTSLPCGVKVSGSGIKVASFRAYQAGYAEGSGSMTVRFTGDELSISNRMIESSLFSSQGGARLKVYLNAVADATGLKPDDSKSLLVEFPVTLLGFSFNLTSEDTPLEASIQFRLSGAPTRLLGLN